MDVYSLARVCLRRWYIFVPILALAVVTSVLRFQSAASVYSASTSLVVLPPSTYSPAPRVDSRVVRVNPFAVGSGGDRTAASALAAVLNGNPTSQLPREAAQGFYSVQVIQSQPVLSVVSTSGTPRGAQLVLEAAQKTAGTSLRQLQLDAGAPADGLYQVVSAGGVVNLGGTKQGATRTLIGLILAGLLLAVLLSSLVDAIAATPRSRRSEGTVMQQRQVHEAAPAAIGT